MIARRRHGLVALATATVLVLAGCGGGDDEAKADPDLQIAASGADAADTLDSAETRFFSDSSPWNTRADDLDVDPASNSMMRLARERVGVVEDGNDITVEPRQITDPVYINTEAWTTPVVAGGEPTKVVCRQIICGDGADSMVLNVPTDIDPDPRYDGWYTIFDTSKSIAYDLWRARREDDGSISYHFMRIWELDGPGFSAPQVVGARGSGLPLFAGLIRPGELNAGKIDHALAISVPGPAQSSFVQPASSTDGNGQPKSLPEGARIRLKADVTLSEPVDPVTGKPIPMTAQQRRYADAITLALRTYGAIVVDRAAVPTLYAQRDVTGDMLRGNELQGLHLEDFEVVELGKRYEYPPDEVDAGDAATPSSDPSATATPTQGAS
ncbi:MULTISPECIES: hypothetical protein [unclassified Nocardioides]|uniref:hypothetical protein n=1 Tax=unclassified Nocardioides TaxID=2615069 RepID=UPI003014ACCC